MLTIMPEPLFKVHFLNLEYLFYLIYQGFHFAAGIVDYYVFGGILGTGYTPGGAGGSGTLGSGYDVTGGPGTSGSGYGAPTGGGGSDYFNAGHEALLHLLKVFLSLLAVVFIVIILYSLVRLFELRSEEKRKLATIIDVAPEPTPKNEQWEKVMERLDSTNPAEWKLAIRSEERRVGKECRL